jgi:hypothetical protein
MHCLQITNPPCSLLLLLSLCGAVSGNTIHLQQPDAIVARVSRLTYGVGCGRHPTPQCAKHGHTTTDKKGQVCFGVNP